ncbi:molybdenum cofactor cytidylyltransferase [Motilibacter rhizosphaerae]|uniref:Molybdenum cofactor cytidylyltransferase n=1 Tax=Motilibacter rhizosphaerae TaxID=598652 RepID=A0A4Q7NWJ5_9ACTN|nr:nucleotidyltransferase family protein [Motilibacter rhizosphaerae]RZS91686.1 molybdenum cofactor cytidylyltransferase [Motilibacter rhizosphaerae]
MSVWALVLAAGASRRLGRPKQLEVVRGRPLLAHALDAASAADEVLVLTGAYAERMGGLLPDVPVLHIANWGRGMGHVLACGVRALPPEAEAVVVLLADTPGIGASAVGEVIAAWHAGAGPVVSAEYDGVSGHPRLFDRSLFAELGDLEGDTGAASLLQRHPVALVPVLGDPVDIDDEETLALAR